MNIVARTLSTAVRPFSTKQKRANRKNMPQIDYTNAFVLIPIEN